MSAKKTTAFFAIISTILVYLSSVIYSSAWIDKKAYTEFPSKNELAFFRFAQKISPNFDAEMHAERVRKLSWLNIQAKIYSKNSKTFQADIMNPLVEEANTLSEFHKRHGFSMNEIQRLKLISMILVYMNRMALFQNYTEPDLDRKLDQRIKSVIYSNDLILTEMVSMFIEKHTLNFLVEKKARTGQQVTLLYLMACLLAYLIILRKQKLASPLPKIN
jgi:hypothetical protein